MRGPAGAACTPSIATLIVRTILDGLAPVTHGAIQPVSWAFTDEVTHLLLRSGPGAGVARRGRLAEQPATASARRTGSRCAFTLITQAGFAVRESVAQVLQRQFRDVGVDMTVQLVDGTSISGLWFEGNFDAMLHWWQMPADPELTLFFAADRMPPHGRNINYFEDRAVTELVYAADRTVDQAERKRLLGAGAAAHRRAAARAAALRRSPSSTRSPPGFAGLHRQSDQHRRLLERARMGAALGKAGWRARFVAARTVPLSAA